MQTEARFTKGPWKIRQQHPDEENYSIQGDRGYHIAKVINFNGKPDNAANARLISAAPDMYEALRMAREAFVVAGSMPLSDADTLALIDAALSKALGSPDPARSGGRVESPRGGNYGL